ncbi:MAG: putative membrane protein/mono/diheme cytochrome c family protein [Planctomycetota bacterium]|jgi:uncharacterized membrane protein/mono/diheme cytochrome c family protein
MLTLTLALCAALPAQQEMVNSSADEVLELFKNHCVGCHGVSSDEKRARRSWDNALDFEATISNEDLLIPGDAENSPLYYTVADGDMPPATADAPPVSPEGLALIADWINAGAALPTDPASAANANGRDDSKSVGESAGSASEQLAPMLRWGGRFHPLLVHFPIALLSLAPLVELLSILLGTSRLKDVASFCLIVGAITAVKAAVLGWFLSYEVSQKGDLDLHRWLGVGTAGLAVLLAIAVFRKPGWRLPGMVLLALLVAFTGHIGGELSWGEDWLNYPAN